MHFCKLFGSIEGIPLLESGDMSIHLGKENKVVNVEQCHSHGSHELFLALAH
jgi:hypothetical protein